MVVNLFLCNVLWFITTWGIEMVPIDIHIGTQTINSQFGQKLKYINITKRNKLIMLS